MGFGTEILAQVQEYPNPSVKEVLAWGRHCLHMTTCQQCLHGFLAKEPWGQGLFSGHTEMQVHEVTFPLDYQAIW